MAKTFNSKKYDRQLRLWGNHGQFCLNNANICLINCSVLGSEILKNLVLAGIGSFCIIDKKMVCPSDITSNFYMTSECLGGNYGSVLLSYLNELNPDVNGEYNCQDLTKLISTDPSFLCKFDMIIGTKTSFDILHSLSTLLWDNGIPLLLADCYGMVGYIKLAYPFCTIIESHPDNEIPDLRITKPFPALISYIDTVNFECLTKYQFHKLPYVVILAKYFEKWSLSKPDLKFPLKRAAKDDFKAFLNQSIDDLWVAAPQAKPVGSEQPEGHANGSTGKVEPPIPTEIMDSTNVEEAIRAINTVLVDDAIPTSLSPIINDPKCEQPTGSSFWIMVKALKMFLDKYGRLPLCGTIPDMTADSETYLKILEIYRTQFMEEAKLMQGFVQERITQIQRAGLIQDIPVISFDDVQLFCKNARHLRLVRGIPIGVEPLSLVEALVYRVPKQPDYDTLPETSDHSIQQIDPYLAKKDLATFYLLCRALTNIINPATRDDGDSTCKIPSVAVDVKVLRAEFDRLISQLSLPPGLDFEFERKDALIEEMVRFSGSELITTASFLAGIASQQIVKIVTKQYVPAAGILVYESMNGSFANFS